MAGQSERTATAGPLARIRDRLGSVTVLHFAMLGFLSIPGYAFEELAVMKLFALFWLAFFWPFVGPLVAMILPSRDAEDDPAGPRDWLEMGSSRAHLAFLVVMPTTFLNPLVLAQDLLQLSGGIVASVRNRGRFPDPEGYDQKIAYRLPVEGTWTVVNGSPIEGHSHSWYPVTQRYAYDFVITDEEGRTRPADADASLEQYYCYDEPVLAPADGVVVAVGDGDPELSRAGGLSHPIKRRITGNYVTVRHTEGEYSTLAHLVPGSVDVAVGDVVERGEPVARCGHSGNSSEPHLHFQLQDHPAFELAAGLPIAFEDVTTETPAADVTESTDWDDPDDGLGTHVHVGQRVTAGPGEASAADERGDADRTSAAVTSDSERRPLAWANLLGRVAVGLVVAGVLTTAAGFVTSSWAAIAGVLAGATAVGVGHRLVTAVAGRSRGAAASLAVSTGLALGAAVAGTIAWSVLAPSIGTATIGPALIVVGLLAYALVWESGGRLTAHPDASAIES